MPRARSLALYWAIRRYLAYCQGKQRTPHTLRWYAQKLEAFRRYMARKQHTASVASVTCLHVQAFLTDLQVTDATARGYRQVLQSFFTWCCTQGYARHNPAQAVGAGSRKRGGGADGRA